MDLVLLSRIQFAVTIAYHFLFVPLSLGLALAMLIAERRYYKSGKPEDLAASTFLIKLLTTTFAVGVATGITMVFAFGTNWATYSRFVGDIFGAPLAAEAVLAFFLESTFLGVLLFGRQRVSKKFYYVSAWLVFFGSHLSALWIIIANSWQQTPAGFKVTGGRAVLTDFFAAAFNPSMLPRYVHTVASTWIVGGFLVAAIGAWYLLKGRHTEFARQAVTAGLLVALVMSIAMPIIGHWHSVQVANTQPAKMAAFEGLYKTGPNAPLILVGWVDETAGQARGIAVPGLLSFLVGFDTNTVIKGFDQFAVSDRPPVQLTFQAYHLMITIGVLLVLLAIVAMIMRWTDRLEKQRWLLRLLTFAPFAAMVAVISGWVAAEVGRQPWIVQGQLRTADAVSAIVPAGQVALTLVLFVVFYTIVYIAWARVFFGTIGRGPQPVAIEASAGDSAATGRS